MERSEADNYLPFSWDYYVTATTVYGGTSAIPAEVVTWEVYKGDKMVLKVSNKPGPLTSTAILPPNTEPVTHPFLTAQALDPFEEDNLGKILGESGSFDEFISLLKANGYELRRTQ